MPGTHAKWVRIADGGLADYRTFMTGELFALLKDKSVLAGALEGAGAVDPHGAAFAAGVKASLETPELIANALFSVRAGWLVHDRKPTDQLARLSGLTQAMVNSLHHQGIDRLAPGLAIEASAPDGQIEAVSMPGAKGFLLGVQWHPEWQFAQDSLSRAIFAGFGASL